METVRKVMQDAVDAWWAEPIGPAEPDSDGECTPVTSSLVQDEQSDAKSPISLVQPAASRRAYRPVSVIDVPTATLARNRLFAGIPGDRRRQAYVTLGATVRERLTQGVLAVTGPRRGAGASLTAVNLAMSLAIDGQRHAVVVDFDFERPTLHHLFETEPATGLEDCLFEGASLDEALFSPAIDRFAVLAARGPCVSPMQVLRSPQVHTLLSAVRERFPGCIIVADLPPVMDQSVASAIETFSDGVLLVVAHELTRAADYSRELEAFSESKLIGTVLNRVPASS